MKNEKLIPASAFVVMTTGVLASVQREDRLPNMNFWIGIAMAYLIISLIAEFNSDIGGGIAVLVMVSALMGNGEDLTKYIGSKTSGKIGTLPKKSAGPVQTRKHRGTPINVYGRPARII